MPEATKGGFSGAALLHPDAVTVCCPLEDGVMEEERVGDGGIGDSRSILSVREGLRPAVLEGLVGAA